MEKVPFTPGMFKADDLKVDPLGDINARVRQSLSEITKSKNKILLEAFARRTGLKGTETQLKLHMHRFKRVVAPRLERVYLDGVPLVEFMDPEFKRVEPVDRVVDNESVTITFQYLDHTRL